MSAVAKSPQKWGMKKSLITLAALLAVVTPALAQWSIEYMSQPRYTMQTAQFSDHAVFVTDSWERYEASTTSWSNGILSQPRVGIRVAQAGTKAYFAGGWYGPYTDPVYVKNVDIYDDATNTWSRANLSVAREAGGTGTLGRQVFFAGGRSAITIHNTVDMFDVQTGAQTRATLSKARHNIAVGSAGNKIVFAGRLVLGHQLQCPVFECGRYLRQEHRPLDQSNALTEARHH